MIRWQITTKADRRPRDLADEHYTRQSKGHPMWTRPGYNLILYLEQRNGRAAAFCWWRPKWESGIKGTERKDGLRCIECALFRNETRFRSSDLVRDAVDMLLEWEHALDVALPDGVITGVGSEQTAAGRSPDSPPGMCFRAAGWEEFEHAKGKADVWLRCTDDRRLPFLTVHAWTVSEALAHFAGYTPFGVAPPPDDLTITMRKAGLLKPDLSLTPAGAAMLAIPRTSATGQLSLFQGAA